MASALKTAEGAIMTRLNTEWASATEIAWPGKRFTKPDAAWIRPTVIWGDGFMQTAGPTNRNQIPGVLKVQIFSKPGNGEGEIKGHADSIRDIFNRVEFSGLRFDAPSGPKPAVERNDWLQTVVDCPFIYEEVVS